MGGRIGGLRVTKPGHHPGYRKCCLNVSHSEGKESRQPGKITDCQASINFRLENPVGEFRIIKDEMSEFPLWVEIVYFFNK